MNPGPPDPQFELLTARPHMPPDIYIPWDVTFRMATILNLNILVQASAHTKLLGENKKIYPWKEVKSISEHVYFGEHANCVKPVQVVQQRLYRILLRTLRIIVIHYIEVPL